jgi:hypothetical protein
MWMIFSCYGCNSTYHDKFNLIKATLTFSGGTSSDTTPEETPTEPADSLISNLSTDSEDTYLTENLEEGDAYYIDRTFTITTISDDLSGLTWILTANDDKNQTSDTFITFDATKNVTLYIGYDKRATKPPSWMSDYAKILDSIEVSDSSASPLNVYKKDYAAGKIVLGANTGSETGAKSMYVVLIKDNGITSCETKTYYSDADGDGYGTSENKALCEAEGNYRASESGDCDDSQSSVNPGAPEVCGNGIDENCDGADITCPAEPSDPDVNNDGSVNIFDLAIVGLSYGSTTFEMASDVNHDGEISMEDLNAVAQNFTKKESALNFCNQSGESCCHVTEQCYSYSSLKKTIDCAFYCVKKED